MAAARVSLLCVFCVCFVRVSTDVSGATTTTRPRLDAFVPHALATKPLTTSNIDNNTNNENSNVCNNSDHNVCNTNTNVSINSNRINSNHIVSVSIIVDEPR